MGRTKKYLLALTAISALSAGILIRGQLVILTAPPSGTWAPTPGPMSAARASASSALLSDGRVLVTGGCSDPAAGCISALASAEFLNADGTFAAAPNMNYARANHSSTVLQDGRVLVAGGTDASGNATQTAELFDPAANTWTATAGPLMAARSSHTATLLQNGQVLIAGGSASGAALSSLELFDPTQNTFSLAPASLTSARENHAAALLSDGRVLIIGGWDGTTSAPVPPATTGNPNVLASSDIYDPVAGTVTAGPALSTARMNFTATVQLDGKVAAIGGCSGGVPTAGADCSGDLASIEVFDPAASTWSLAPGALVTARQRHLAFLLPHNNAVLIVGGSSNGTALNSSELYMPWTGSFSTSSNALSSPRTTATGSPLSSDGILLVAGGSDGTNSLATADVYGFATVKTDKADYAPGTTVNITGSGWQPNETVTLTIVESPLIDTHGPYTVTSDANGNISDSSFTTNPLDLNIKFTLTAVGSVSQAQTMFTDSAAANVIFATTSPCAVTGSATYTNNGGHFISGEAFTTGTGSATKGTSPSTQVTYTYPASVICSGTTYNFVSASPASGFNSGASGSNTNVTATYTAQVATTLTLNSVSPNSIPFSSTGPVTFTATLTRTTGGAAVSGATVNFTVDGGAAGSAVTNASGVATFSTYNPSALSVASHNVQTSFSAATISGVSYLASTSGTLPLTITKATPTITWSNPADITYGAALSATQLDATASVPGTFAYTPVSGTVLNAGSGQTLTVTFTPTDSTDYTTAAKNVTINVNAKTLTASIIGNPSKPYDGNTNATLSSANFQLSGLVGSDSFTVTQAAGSYNSASVATATTVTASLSAGNFTANGTTQAGNYVLPTTASGPGQITKANATVVVTPYTVTYDGNPHTATVASITGVNGETGATVGTVTLNTTHTAAGTYSSDTWSFTGTTNYNKSRVPRLPIPSTRPLRRLW